MICSNCRGYVEWHDLTGSPYKECRRCGIKNGLVLEDELEEEEEEEATK